MKSFKVILDSGAVSLYNEHANNNSHGTYLKDRVNVDYSFFKTPEFEHYRDEYIKFVKKYGKYLTAYINLDVISNPEMSYDSLEYMEQKGCTPLPVFHIGSDTKWLKRYIDEG